ncbi:MAG TPA: DUF932 domain-containing protein [Thermoanaerobaculia bacterium]|nr:DUF932 domain-containing protein [Thermoanaerobaculia bacterium]
MNGLLAHCGAELMTRQNLLEIQTPPGTDTHKPIPHAHLVETVIQTLGFRNIEVTRDQYALTADGMRMFGIIEVNLTRDGVNFTIGLRNSHDKSFSLGMCAGWRTLVCDNLAFHSDFEALARKHTKNLVLDEVLGVAIDRVQRAFGMLGQKLDAWAGFSLSDKDAKVLIYDAFVGERLEAPKHLMRSVNDFYFEPKFEEFKPRTMLSLNNAFTSAFGLLDPVPMVRATASLAGYLETVN